MSKEIQAGNESAGIASREPNTNDDDANGHEANLAAGFDSEISSKDSQLVPPFFLLRGDKCHPLFSELSNDKFSIACKAGLIPSNTQVASVLLLGRGGDLVSQPLNRLLEEIEAAFSIENDVSLQFPAMLPLSFNINNSFCEDLTISDVHFAHIGAVGPDVPVVAQLSVEPYHFANVWNSFVQRAESASFTAESEHAEADVDAMDQDQDAEPDAIETNETPTQLGENIVPETEPEPEPEAEAEPESAQENLDHDGMEVAEPALTEKQTNIDESDQIDANAPVEDAQEDQGDVEMTDLPEDMREQSELPADNQIEDQAPAESNAVSAMQGDQTEPEPAKDATVLEPEAEPDIAAESNVEAEAEAEIEAEAEVEAEADVEAELEAEAEADAPAEVDVEAELQAETQAEAEVEAETAAEVEVEVDTDAHAEPEADAEAGAELIPEEPEIDTDGSEHAENGVENQGSGAGHTESRAQDTAHENATEMEVDTVPAAADEPAESDLGIDEGLPDADDNMDDLDLADLEKEFGESSDSANPKKRSREADLELPDDFTLDEEFGESDAKRAKIESSEPSSTTEAIPAAN